MKAKILNLESDCENEPTKEMRLAMRNAKIGDDDHRKDPTINHLEEIAAKKLGKESALFCLNGTMANIIAIHTHCQRGDKIILVPDMHIYYAEMKGITTITGVIPYIIENISQRSVPNLTDLDIALKGQYAESLNISLLCLENPHNYWGGIIMNPEDTEKICQIAHRQNVLVHLDGARVFNAAIALKVNVFELVKSVDSVMLCLNKGLAAPVGAMLAGSQDFIDRARQNRKMLGGHMRQMGIMAAAGIVALEKMIDRLEEDHKNALTLAKELTLIEELRLNFEDIKPQTNIVTIDIGKLNIEAVDFRNTLIKYNIICRIYPFTTKVRFVTHYGITEKDITRIVKSVKEVINEQK